MQLPLCDVQPSRRTEVFRLAEHAVFVRLVAMRDAVESLRPRGGGSVTLS